MIPAAERTITDAVSRTPEHRYLSVDIAKGDVAKAGISVEPLNASGTSARGG
jgi:hypothetical protein